MPEKKSIKRKAVSKKRTKSPYKRNRYMRRAKHSEYQFLKLLRAYADEDTAFEAAQCTVYSERRIREIYDGLRDKLMRAVILYPKDFGWAGYFLFDGEKMSPRGQMFFDAVAENGIFKRMLNTHAPRVGLTSELHPSRFSGLLFETTVRIFCMLSMNKTNETLYSNQTLQSFDNLKFLAEYIDRQKNNPDKPEFFKEVTERFNYIMKRLPVLLGAEELSSLIEGYTRHNYSNDLFYDHLRRYLLSDPL